EAVRSPPRSADLDQPGPGPRADPYCPHPSDRARLVSAGGVLRGVGAGLLRFQRRRVRGPAGVDREAGLSAVAGGGLPVAAPVLRLAPPRPRGWQSAPLTHAR